MMSQWLRRRRGAGNPSPRTLQLGPMLLRPFTDERERLIQRAAERGQAVLDARWHHGVHRALDESVLFDGAQRLREHLLRDTAQGTLQFAGAPGAAGEGVDERDGPFVGQQCNDQAGACNVHEGM
jgi:hypothetical protein